MEEKTLRSETETGGHSPDPETPGPRELGESGNSSPRASQGRRPRCHPDPGRVTLTLDVCALHLREETSVAAAPGWPVLTAMAMAATEPDTHLRWQVRGAPGVGVRDEGKEVIPADTGNCLGRAAARNVFLGGVGVAPGLTCSAPWPGWRQAGGSSAARWASPRFCPSFRKAPAQGDRVRECRLVARRHGPHHFSKSTYRLLDA